MITQKMYRINVNRKQGYRGLWKGKCVFHQGIFHQGIFVGSLLRYFNVAVIPGFPDARICGRLPRFGTLVPGAQGRAHAALVLFPHFRYHAQRLRTCRRSLSLSQVGRVVRGVVRCSCQMSKRINMTSGGRVL